VSPTTTKNNPQKKLTFREENNEYVDPPCVEEQAYYELQQKNQYKEPQYQEPQYQEPQYQNPQCYEEEDYAHMAEMEEIEPPEDQHQLVTMDADYIRTIEEENVCLRCEVEQLRFAVINLDRMYQAEAAKVRAFCFNAQEQQGKQEQVQVHVEEAAI
jgi:hypothetical protein